RAIAVTSRTRWKDLPDVATVEEAGLPGFELISWTGVAATGGIPKPIVARLNTEGVRAIAVPEIRARLQSFGGGGRGSTPGGVPAVVEGQIALWARLGKEANIQLE